jgi:hypothetical protein
MQSVELYLGLWDGISIRFLRLILPLILLCITHKYNTVLTCSTFLEACMVSKILLVPKISVLPALSKALEVFMRDQMIRCIAIDGNRLFSPYLLRLPMTYSVIVTIYL